MRKAHPCGSYEWAVVRMGAGTGLAVVFLALDTVRPSFLFTLGAYVNTWLALFNLIPFGPLDGAKIFRWNKGIWLAAAAGAGGLFVAQRFF
ncbi:MAG: DUF951 family protein [Dehalococcoidia bacterium]